LHTNLICFVKILLCKHSQACYFIDAMFIFVLFEHFEHALIYDSQGKALQHFQVRVVSISKTGVNKTRVINRSHLIKKVEGSLGKLNSLFSGINEVFHAFDTCFVKVQDP